MVPSRPRPASECVSNKPFGIVRAAWWTTLAIAIATTGCMSPYAADRGALLGGATGAGAGALIGSTTGNTLAGTLIGGGLGAVTGGAIGAGFDEVEAKNRAAIEATLGQQVRQGAVTIDDVIMMTKSGVQEDLIATHVRNNGMVAPLTAPDLVTLQQQGVSPRVVQAMQAPPPQAVQRVAGPAPVYVEEIYYPPPYWGPYWGPPCYRPCRVRPGVSWGVSVRN
jgi:hypothetical protein